MFNIYLLLQCKNEDDTYYKLNILLVPIVTMSAIYLLLQCTNEDDTTYVVRRNFDYASGGHGHDIDNKYQIFLREMMLMDSANCECSFRIK